MANYDRGPGSYGFMNPAPMQEPVQPIYDRGPVMIPQPVYDRGPTMAPEPQTPAPTTGLSTVELPLNNKLPPHQPVAQPQDANISEQQWLANQTRSYYPFPKAPYRPTGWFDISMFMPERTAARWAVMRAQPQIADSFGGPNEKYKELRDKMRNFQWGGGPDMRYSEWL